ncbi:MAG TPA: hypothetical protein GX708_24590 [Gallicola sp.]|nr:hypothetical protein [Gallicola sp.]
MKQTLKTSKQWYDELPEDKKIIILDPDGWDRSNYEYSFNEELITYDEFQKRLLFSTCKFNESVWEIQDNDIQDCEPIEIEDTVVSFNQPNSHGVVYRDNPFNLNEAPEDNSHGDLVSLVWLIEKLRRREGGCIMNELIAEAKKHFSGLQYIKEKPINKNNEIEKYKRGDFS